MVEKEKEELERVMDSVVLDKEVEVVMVLVMEEEEV